MESIIPECKSCKKRFSNYVTIDGKTHNISKRTNCLECVPFGTRRTVDKDNNLIYTDCVCTSCGREYKYHHTTGHTLTKCNSCMTNAQKDFKVTKSIEYLGGKCVICGYTKCVRALNFHHLDPSTKKFGISGSHCRSWEVLEKELDKCVILCANCHMEVEDGIIDLTKYLAD